MKNLSSLDDTIVAVSTPVGEGGIGIVRMSGRDSLSIADKIFRSKEGKVPSRLKSYTTHYGHIVDTGKSREVIDEVIMTIMRSPRSYTKEDTVEINCHGGMVPLKRILELILSLGAALAEPGEFTKRAFLNGRIDLAQAESVLDIIKAKTDASLHAAMGQLEGALSKKVRSLREELFDLASHVEGSIDFPEEDIEILSDCRLKKRISGIIHELEELIKTADRGTILREGVRTVICGRPNVGKSSLMNSLLKENRVIVSHIPGTTRDAIEELINIDGIPLKVIDTAGILEAEDLLTKEGVERSRFHIRSADLVVFVLDGSEPITDNDRVIIDGIREKNVIVVVNKRDLPGALDLKEIEGVFGKNSIIEISVTKDRNINALEGAISRKVWGGEVETDHTVMVTNARHKTLLGGTKSVLERALKDANNEVPAEILSIHIKEAIESLGEITGETIDEEILNKIFGKFCIGK